MSEYDVEQLEFVYDNFCQDITNSGIFGWYRENAYLAYEKNRRIEILYNILKSQKLSTKTKKRVYFAKENCEPFIFDITKTGIHYFIMEFKCHTYALTNFFYNYDKLRAQLKMLEKLKVQYKAHQKQIEKLYPKIHENIKKRQFILDLLLIKKDYVQEYEHYNAPRMRFKSEIKTPEKVEVIYPPKLKLIKVPEKVPEKTKPLFPPSFATKSAPSSIRYQSRTKNPEFYIPPYKNSKKSNNTQKELFKRNIGLARYASRPEEIVIPRKSASRMTPE